MSAPVLVIGAGPTGLTAACALRSLGVPCRIVDRRSGPGSAPKGLVLWSGALECLHRIGVAHELARVAMPLTGASYWSGGRRIAKARFGGLENTGFPGPLCVPQPVTEQALHHRLQELGGSVEWETEATEVQVNRGPTDQSVTVTLRSHGAEETVTVPWLIAADGARSRVRESVGIPFEGHTFDRTFLIGDGRLEGAPTDAEVQHHITPAGVLVIVPQPGGHRVFFDTEPDGQSEPPTIEQLQLLLDERGPGGLRLEGIWWSSRFRVHAKVAPRFRDGPVLLAGDAVHAHTTAGGQGLNTGVQDGYDIGWKLASVIRGCDPSLLESFEAERRPASVRAVRSGDQQTRMWLLRTPLARALRNFAMRALSGTGVLETKVVPLLAQLDLDHSRSVAVADLAGAGNVPRAMRLGRRAPELPLTPVHGTAVVSLHAQLAAGRHTLLVYGDTAGECAVQAAAALRARGAADTARVLWVRPGGAAVDQAAKDAGCDVARDHSGAFAGARAPWLVYIRPDGVIGARGGPAGLAALLTRMPSRPSQLTTTPLSRAEPARAARS
ncbi:FAD-dependent monooxygenase [Streptomyces albipurpureus]|uniref:FAD-dependent monooxygenase n=1 Tax=Streptomyces albipurpureus TaxID=2897419 RepID=A0ABT0UVX7_9ACTN|nr:FAD-dependent monooxygenase [Streptomyces sp. CWNU-1]MCM2391795.1 FAD-dependent monooxygenase [Streptomyces sp. CWNU-1]